MPFSCCQDINEHHGCVESCTRLPSCVYFQHENDQCFLCINAAADVTAEGGLTSATAQQQRTLVKTGIEDVIFTSQNCRNDEAIFHDNQNFDQHTSGGNLARIKFCSSDHGAWSDKVGGFQLVFGTVSQNSVGCWASPVWDVIPDFVLAERETVLVVEACFGPISIYNNVHTIKLVTNLRSFGPVGTDGGCTVYRNVGYDLTGFYGRAVYGIDSLGTYFSRC